MLLFVSQVSRESRRIDSTVIRFMYALFSLSILWTVAELDPRETGLALLRAMTVVHAALAVLLAVRLAGDVAGDRASGVVGLLYLSGIESKSVVLAQLMQMTTAFLSVWLVRVPMLVLAYHLGGTTLHQILQVEALLVGLFGMTVCAGLLMGHYAPDRATSRMVFLMPPLLDFGLTIPTLLVATVHYLTPYNVPLSVEYAFDSLKYLRTTSCLFHSLGSPYPSAMSLWPLVLQFGIAALSLWAWRRVYFTCLDEAEVPPTPENTPQPFRPSKSKSRPSRPIWDDGLAWQAYYVHSDGTQNLLARSFLIGGCLVGTLVLVSMNDPGYRGLGMALLIITTGLMMFIGRGKVSDCLQKEIKDKTLPALLMTPHSPLELCDGWGRGAWKLMQPDLVLYAACGVGCLIFSPMTLAPIICGGAILILASGPFFVLSPLVPFSFTGILSGLGLIGAVLGMLVITIPLSVEIHPWLGPALIVPLAWGWNRLCCWMIPKWFSRKQEELV
jgi:hypothetical protein